MSRDCRRVLMCLVGVSLNPVLRCLFDSLHVSSSCLSAVTVFLEATVYISS